ncbi:hypothetical protein GLOIN_2v1549563 [Rhizophagus clarus]|uniref:F-box domain-containing protein n=1 Tax=Rhizophagus clarus TaxID=94130 RepID=A0A8H3L5E5_9GLOM|nr:hypothetical protein GLOIN_2v1549563 [Rhizophagus clarus]
MFQLPADCLNDIIEYLEDDKHTLHSCILVNRLWCETNQKKILYDNKIISTPTTKFPTFNYASFCKVLFIYQVYYNIDRLLRKQQTISSHNLKNYLNIVNLIYDKCFGNFEKLQYAFFPRLQVLKIKEKYPRVELLIKFLEINGKNLKEICIGDFYGDSDNSLNLAIAKFCPNLRILSTGIKDNELETLKMIFGSCKSLKSIKIWCGNDYLNEKEALEFVVKYSQNIHELIFYHLFVERIKLLPEELESFFISWTNRKPQKSISLVIGNDNSHSLAKNYENMEIIKKYIKLGFIKKFKVTNFDDVEYN